MSKSDEMRRLIDLANGNSKAPVVESEDLGSPTANFARWGKLGEGWDEGAPRHDDPVIVNVWQDKDPLGDGLWFWTKSRGGHIFANGGNCGSEEEAHSQAGGLAEDEGGMSMVGEEDMLSHPAVLDEAVHLMRPRGGSECGAACDEHNCSPEINEVTCPECIKGHDEFMKRFEFSDDGELDEDAESYLDRMYAAHLKAERGFNYHTNKALEEGIESDTVTGPAHWASYLINGDDSGMTDEEIAACNAWQKKLEPWYVVSTADDDEPRFTNSYDIHSGTDIRGGSVIDYVVHKGTEKTLDEDDVMPTDTTIPAPTPVIDEEDAPNHEMLKRDLEHAVTRYDRQQENNARNRSYNPNALGIYLRRVDDIIADVEAGMEWKEAVTRGFTDRLRDYVLSYMINHGHI